MGINHWLLTGALPVAQPGANAGFGCDGHHCLTNGPLPAVAHVPTDARCHQDRIVQASMILPNIVHHDGSDHFKAVWVTGLRKMTEVLCRLHLKDLRQWDLLQGQIEEASGFCSSDVTPTSENTQRLQTSPLYTRVIHCFSPSQLSPFLFWQNIHHPTKSPPLEIQEKDWTPRLPQFF